MSAPSERPDPRGFEALDVFVGDGTGRDVHVGALVRTPHGCELRYLSGGLDPRLAISHCLPVRAAPYPVHGVNLPPFFAGLLPEGLRLRALVFRLKTSEDDLFSLLAAVGGDTVGAVTVAPSGELPARHGPFVDLAHPVPDLRALLEQSVGRSGGAEAALDRRALAGVQPKVSAARLSPPLRALG